MVYVASGNKPRSDEGEGRQHQPRSGTLLVRHGHLCPAPLSSEILLLSSVLDVAEVDVVDAPDRDRDTDESRNGPDDALSYRMS